MDRFYGEGQGYKAAPCGRRERPVRSAALSAVEIDQERARSGWNPYEGEEEASEPPRMSALPDRRSRTESKGAERGRHTQPDGGGLRREKTASAEPDMAEPFARPVYGPQEILLTVRELEEAEKDRRRLQAMYPAAARAALPYIEEECDKLEYEGSPMFDAVPDQETVRRLCGEICRKTAEQEDFQATQYQPSGRDRREDDRLDRDRRGNDRRPDRGWPEDLVRVLLLEEMHQRRRRHRRCCG